MAAVDVLGFIGILLIIGFLADYLFRKMSLPDVLILLVLGYLIGPLLNIISPSHIAPASQIIASLALVTILFNGGLDLEFDKIIRSAPRALIMVLLGISVSMVATAAFVYYILDFDLMNSLLLGAIVSGTSPAIVMPLVRRAKVPGEVSAVLNLESAFNGALVIVISLVILEVMTTGGSGNEVVIAGQTIAVRFVVGIATGIAAGIFWLWVLAMIEGEVYDDILTLAMVFLLYFIVESIQGSGAIFVLVFGVILGNGMRVARFFKIKRTIEVHELMRKFHSQVSFLIKTFFFVYLGLMITFDEPILILQGVVLSFILLFARYIIVLLSSIGNKTLLSNKGILTTMLPRGLSAAVVAEIVLSSGIPGTSDYSDIIIVVIIATVVISAIGIPVFTRKSQKETDEPVQD